MSHNADDIRKMALSKTQKQWQALRDSAPYMESWCLYNAYKRLNEALTREKALEISIWGFILLQLHKGSDQNQEKEQTGL